MPPFDSYNSDPAKYAKMAQPEQRARKEEQKADRKPQKISSAHALDCYPDSNQAQKLATGIDTTGAPNTVAPTSQDANNLGTSSATAPLTETTTPTNSAQTGVKTQSVPTSALERLIQEREARIATILRRPNKEMLERLTIYKRDFVEQPYRLLSRSASVEQLLERNSVMGPFKDGEDFQARALKKVANPVRKYNIEGHSAVIILREPYARQLTSENGSCPEELRQRVKPSLIPSLLDEMPNSTYVRRVFLDDRANTQDDYLTQTVDQHGFVTEMAMANGQLDMYRYDLKQFLRRDVLHEWSHALRYHYWDDELAWRFGDATDLEGPDWHWRKYGARNKGEAWAVLGEPLLGYSADGFLEAVEKAPIRSVVWMRALEKCLNEMTATRSVNHNQYLARMNYVKDLITPIAAERLKRIINDPAKLDWQHAAAQRVLTYIERKADLEQRH